LAGATAVAGSLLGCASTPEPAAGAPPQRTGVQAVLDRSTTRTPPAAACGSSTSDAPLLERSGAAFVARLERLLHGPDVQLQIVAYLRHARRVI
jgi:hypothetical protein